jgi:hypothetical protein
MSTEAIGVAAPGATIVMDTADPPPESSKPTGLHSPPDSNGAMNLDGSDSELSDLEDVVGKLQEEAELVADEVDDIGEVIPDHYSGTVPVFRPAMQQFRDFKRFVRGVTFSAHPFRPILHVAPY